MTGAPSSQQIEVSLFGPGVGECVVLHLGNNRWAIIDSCLSKETRRPIALEYFEELGVDVSSAVELVVVSHFHDDHIRGIAEIARAANNAKVIASSALGYNREFFEFLSASREAIGSLGGNEFVDLLRALQARAPGAAAHLTLGPDWKHADSRIYQRSAAAGVPEAEMWVIAPSSAALNVAFHEIANIILPAVGEPQRRAVALTPNRAAVVNWISVGNARVLLGADLEDGGGPKFGWRAVVSSENRPQTRAQVFKVAHHGSVNGHNDDVWTHMLTAAPYALLTPFSTGSKFLPADADIARIIGKTPRAFCTAPPRRASPARRDNAVERTIKEIAIDRHALTGRMGHVRLRADVSEPEPVWSLELMNGAVSLA